MDIEKKLNELGFFCYIEENVLNVVKPFFRTIKLKKNYDLNYCLEKLNKSQNINYCKLFEKLNINVAAYSASYGLGIETILPEFNSIVEKIENYLQKNEIEYKTQFSDKGWIYRFKFSQNKNNIEKIKKILDK